MIDTYLEAITKIANHPRIKEHLEPNVFWHEDIKTHQTKRILYALRLFEDELYKITREPISETSLSS